MGRKRQRARTQETARPAKKQAAPAATPARTYGTEIAKATKQVKPINGEYIVRIQKSKGLLIIEGDHGKTSEVSISGGENVTTLLDSNTARAFSILKGPLTIERRGDNLRVSETEGKSPTSFSINIRPPVENFGKREFTYSQGTFNGSQVTTVRDDRGFQIAEIVRGRDETFTVYEGGRPKTTRWGEVPEGGIRTESLQSAKLIAANFPGPSALPKDSPLEVRELRGSKGLSGADVYRGKDRLAHIQKVSDGSYRVYIGERSIKTREHGLPAASYHAAVQTANKHLQAWE
jgi:hypothetical protein